MLWLLNTESIYYLCLFFGFIVAHLFRNQSEDSIYDSVLLMSIF